ncbi:MAG: LacI family transcriptional regulator [Hyphomicrobiales bacterium]|nr:MAG: LacI family transcriptional regulator [Hyphomicrobiales bacterium]
MTRATVATIKDVAREAGVSISTVSSVVNGNKPVSEELAVRVREAIQKLHFEPNHMARSLHARRTQTLAYLTPDITNVAFLRTFKAIETTAHARGYTVFLLGTDGSVETTKEALDRVIGLRMDGAFFTMNWAVAQSEVRLQRLADRGIAMVGVSGSYDLPEIDCFLRDEEGGGYQVGDYLRRLGHRHVLCVGPTSSRSAEMRWGGLRAALEDGGSASVIMADMSGYAAQTAYNAVQAALARRTKFTGVVAFNDAIASGALAALADNGIDIPSDVSFVSFGDAHMDFHRPQITSVTFDEEGIARLAANRLIDRIEGRVTEPPAHERLPLKLSIRPSSRRLEA